MRFLVVEDDFTSRMILRNYLNKQGSVDVAVNGEEGIEAFKHSIDNHRPYDLVLLDIMMPGLDGHFALKEIRRIEKDANSDGKEIPVIMTTALDDPKNVVEAYYKGGASAYLVKPISREKLMKTMQELHLI